MQPTHQRSGFGGLRCGPGAWTFNQHSNHWWFAANLGLIVWMATQGSSASLVPSGHMHSSAGLLTASPGMRRGHWALVLSSSPPSSTRLFPPFPLVRALSLLTFP